MKLAKGNNAWLDIYADEVDTHAWRDFCDIVGVSYDTTHIAIQFNTKLVETDED